MAEGRMADVVNESERFGEAGVEPQSIGNCARNLSDLDGMRQPVAEMIGITGCENLGLGFQAAKGARVNYAVAVAAQESGARGSAALPLRRMPAAPASLQALRFCRAGERVPGPLVRPWGYRDTRI
jgi:hypothetical protein